MSGPKTGGDQKPTISPNNHDQNIGQRGGKLRATDDKSTGHTEEPNTGMRVSEEGNKVQGDDLEDIIPGKQASKRGAETFDAEGEPLERDKSASRGHDEDPEGDGGQEGERGAETFDISEDVHAGELVDRNEGNRRGDFSGEKPPATDGKRGRK